MNAPISQCLPKRRLKLGTGWYFIKSKDLSRVEHLYDALSRYILTEKRELLFAFQRGSIEEGGRTFLKETALQKYLDRCKEHAHDIANEFEIQECDSYDLLKVLCTLYFNYTDNERSRIAQVLKKDIEYLIDFIEVVYEVSPGEISKKLGRLGGLKNALYVIFPNRIEEAKDDTFHTMELRLKTFNEVMPDEYRLEKTELRKFCEFLEPDFSLLFQTIQALNKDWHRATAFRGNNLFTHLRNLAILVENVIREIGETTVNEEMRTRFLKAPARHRNLGDSLRRMFGRIGEEPWWGAFVYANKKMKVNEVDFEMVDKIIKHISEKSFHKEEWMNFVIKNFLIVVVVRNFSAHRVKYHRDFFRVYYVSVVDAIIYALIYLWVNARNKRLLSSPR